MALEPLSMKLGLRVEAGLHPQIARQQHFSRKGRTLGGKCGYETALLCAKDNQDGSGITEERSTTPGRL